MQKIQPFSHFKKAGASGGFGDGSDGDLTILNGQTVNLAAGSIRQYNNIDIQAGGTLNITGNAASITELYALGTFNLDGQILARDHSNAGYSFSGTTLFGYAYSVTSTQRTGGNGGNGGRTTDVGFNSPTALGNGGIAGAGDSLGRGGGGGGGACIDGTGNGGNGGTNGNGGTSGDLADISVNNCADRNNPAGGAGGGTGVGSAGGPNGYGGDLFPPAVNGGAGASGGGGGGASISQIKSGSPCVYAWGGGGGGGGFRGSHGVPLFIAAGQITGAGTIDTSGNTGFSGGNGGGGNNGTRGGGGGGGAGGNGGNLYLQVPSGYSCATNVNGGSSGSGGASGGAGASVGVAGQTGLAGSLVII